jgi:hypothetical protein
MAPWATLSGLSGRTIQPEELKARIRRFGWAGTFVQLARMAALLANSPEGAFGPEVRGRTFGALAKKARGVDPTWWLFEHGPGSIHPDSVIAHEKVIYFLQALAALECGTSGSAPGDADVAFLMAAANDLLPVTTDESSTGDPEVDLMADVLSTLRFNRSVGGIVDVVRTFEMFLSGSIDRAIARANPHLRAGGPLIPVVVTLGDLAGNSLLYRWIDRRCDDEDLFQQNGVLRPVIAQVRDYEQLLCLMASGESGFELLSAVRRHDDQRLDVVVGERSGRDHPPALPFLKSTFEEVGNRIMDRAQASLRQSKP